MTNGSNSDNYLGIHPQALTLEAQRTELLAANLANADTPNYKARDIDFKAALRPRVRSGSKCRRELALTAPGAPLQPMATMPPVSCELGSASACTSSATVAAASGNATVGTAPTPAQVSRAARALARRQYRR